MSTSKQGHWSVFASRVMLLVAFSMFALAGWRLWSQPGAWWRIRPLPQVRSETGRATLLVVYQAKDCSSYQAFIQRWESVDPAVGLDVVGVPLDADNPAPWARRALEDVAPSYPIRPELTSDAIGILAGMRALRTPVAILLDGSGRPRLVLPAPADPRELSRARDVVLAYHSLKQAAP